MYNLLGSYYYIVIILQIICAVHAYRNGKQNWLWWIIIGSVIGCAVYFFAEVLPSRRRGLPQINVGAISAAVNPAGRIKKLEENLRFTDTFNNRVLLADAYLQSSQLHKAIDVYESSLTGAFTENEHVNGQLIVAYFKTEQYDKAVKAAQKIYKHPQFIRSQGHLYYAMSLENLGKAEQAESEFKAMQGRYSYYEQRYYYGMFLIRQERNEEAAKVFQTMLDEETHLSSMERKGAREWCSKARAELKTIA